MHIIQRHPLGPVTLGVCQGSDNFHLRQVPAHNRGLVFFQDVTVEFVQRHGPGDGIPHIPLLLTKIAVDVQIFIVNGGFGLKTFHIGHQVPIHPGPARGTADYFIAIEFSHAAPPLSPW